MEESGLVGIATYVMRDKQQLGCMRVRDGMLVLEKMFFADEIRPTDDIAPRKARRREQELAMALDLIDRFRGPFEPEATRTPIAPPCSRVIDRKRKGKDVHVEPQAEREAPTDLLEALRASVEAHGRNGRGSRGGRKRRPGRHEQGRPREARAEGRASRAARG